MNRIEKTVWDLAQPVVEAAGLELWDVEYVTEAGQRYLRIYLDSPDGVDLDACERVSRAMDPILDEADPVPDSMILLISLVTILSLYTGSASTSLFCVCPFLGTILPSLII